MRDAESLSVTSSRDTSITHLWVILSDYLSVNVPEGRYRTYIK